MSSQETLSVEKIESAFNTFIKQVTEKPYTIRSETISKPIPQPYMLKNQKVWNSDQMFQRRQIER